MKIRSLKLPSDLDTRLDEYARARGTTRSSVVREAVEVYLAREDERSEESVLARIRDLSGCVAGPADLSSNPEYLRGYGATADDASWAAPASGAARRPPKGRAPRARSAKLPRSRR